MWFSRVAIAAVCIVSSGCGYALAGRGSFLPASIRTVGILQFENQTTAQIEQILTEKVRTEFIGRGRYTIRPDAIGADAVLAGEITSFNVQPVGLTDQQLASRYLFTVVIRVRFTDVRSNEALWSDDALTFRSEYELSTRSATAVEGAALVDQERTAIDRLSTDMARSVVTAILEAF